MESDIVTRLRGAAAKDYGCTCVKCEAADEIERLRAELSKKFGELAAAIKQRDEAIRLLGVMVAYIRDGMPSGHVFPEHYCFEKHRPDIGICKICDSWQDANILLYGDEWGSEYDADRECAAAMRKGESDAK